MLLIVVQQKKEKKVMKTKTMFAWAILAILLMPLLFVLSACGEDKDAEAKITLTAKMVEADKNLVYNGEQQRPKIKVSATSPQKQVFTEGVDYEIVWTEDESVNVKTVEKDGDINYHYTIKALSTSKKLEGETTGDYYISTLDISKSEKIGVEVDKVVFDIQNGLDYAYEPTVKIKNQNTGTYFANSLFDFKFSENTKPTQYATVTVTPKKEVGENNIKGAKTVNFEIKKADISSAKITFNDSDTYTTTYTGQAIDVSGIIKVTYRNNENNEPIYIPLGVNTSGETDEQKYGFEVTTLNNSNVNAGTATIKISAHSQNPYLQGEITKTFTIEKCEFDESFSVLMNDEQNKNYYYTSQTITPEITVKSSKILSNDGVVNKDAYDKKYYIFKNEAWTEFNGNIVDVGKYKVKINSKQVGNFSGSVEKEFEVVTTNISGGQILFSGKTSFSTLFTGNEIKPDVTLTLNIDGTKITLNGDDVFGRVVCSFENNTNVGNELFSPTVTITGDNVGFVGQVSKTFEITPVNLSDENNGIEIGKIGDQTFNNTQITPDFKLTYVPKTLLNAYSLDKKKDVEIVYGKTTFGVCVVTIKAGTSGNFVGQTQTSFNILPANIKDAVFDVFESKDYDFGNQITLSKDDVKASFMGEGTTAYELVFGYANEDQNDFALTYENNTESGTATVTITGKNHFEGTTTKTFEINPISYTTQSEGENLNEISKNEQTFDLIGNPNFTRIIVANKNVTANSGELLDTQQIVVNKGASLTLNTFVGSNITNENVDISPDFGDEDFNPENFEFSIVQNNISSKFELESAMKFAGSLKLSQNILEAVELLNAFQNTTTNQGSQVAVRKLDLNGFGLLGDEHNNSSRNLVVDKNVVENLSVFLYLTNSSETPSVVGSQNTEYGLDLRGGEYAGSDTSFKSFDFAMIANNITFQGRYGGILTQGNCSNTFDDETNQGKMFLLNFTNCKFNSLEEWQTVEQAQTYPASAVLLAGAQSVFENCEFSGASGIFVNAGQNAFCGSKITATSMQKTNFSSDFGILNSAGFGTGSGLIVQSKGKNTSVGVYVSSATITSASNFAVEEFKVGQQINEESKIVLHDVTLSSGTSKHFSLEDQHTKGSTDETNILTSTEVVVNPTSDEAINNALLNDCYEQTIINQVNIKSDYTENYNHQEIYAGEVVVMKNATLTVSHYYHQVSVEQGKINFVSNENTTKEEVINAIENELWNEITLNGRSFELAITEATTTQITVCGDTTVVIDDSSQDDAFAQVQFNLMDNSSLVLTKCFNSLNYSATENANVVQQNIKTASELEKAMTYANKIVLGSSIVGKVNLLSQVKANSTINVEIDLFGHDILTGNSRLYVAENNQIEGISANITITSSKGNSYIGNRLTNDADASLINDQAPYGLDIRGGNFRGTSTTTKGFNLCLNVSNVVLQGQYGGAVINGSYENTFNSETNEGLKLEVNFYNVTFNATTKEDIDTKTNITYTPAGAYFAGKSNLTAQNCTFKGGTGLYVKAGNILVKNSQILATEIPEGFTYKQSTPNNDGYYGNGSAFVLDTHSSYAGPAHVVLNSVTFESTVGYAIDEYRSYGTVDGNPTITVLGTTTINNTALGFAKIESSGEVLVVKDEVVFKNITTQKLFEDAVKHASTINLACDLNYLLNGFEITKSITISGITAESGKTVTIEGDLKINGTLENPITVTLNNLVINGQITKNEYATVLGNYSTASTNTSVEA